MAEILLSLTIIGVVAAITLPSLTGNINERTWNTQRKALYARFSQAIALMPALNGYGTLTTGTDASGSTIVTEDTAAETFVTAGLAKVLKINNICAHDHLADCGIPAKLNPLLGGSAVDFPTYWYKLEPKMLAAGLHVYGSYSELASQINAKAAAFETANGESVAVFYNKNCKFNMNEDSYFVASGRVCANFIFDLNGTKGPNTVGKDIGVMTILYPSDPKIAAPYPAVNPLTGTYALKPSSAGSVSASKACTNYDSEYRLPNAEELSSMVVNASLFGTISGNYWSSSPVGNGSGYWLTWNDIGLDDHSGSYEGKVWCIKR